MAGIKTFQAKSKILLFYYIPCMQNEPLSSLNTYFSYMFYLYEVLESLGHEVQIDHIGELCAMRCKQLAINI